MVYSDKLGQNVNAHFLLYTVLNQCPSQEVLFRPTGQVFHATVTGLFSVQLVPHNHSVNKRQEGCSQHVGQPELWWASRVLKQMDLHWGTRKTCSHHYQQLGTPGTATLCITSWRHSQGKFSPSPIRVVPSENRIRVVFVSFLRRTSLPPVTKMTVFRCVSLAVL